MTSWFRRLSGALMCSAFVLGAAQAESFDFVALGDTAYNGRADEPVLVALIDRINRAQPAFTLHVGDVWGGERCLDDDHRRILRTFERFEQPLIYTPGDNEWTDCVDPAVVDAYERIESGRPQEGDAQRWAEFRQLGPRASRSGRWALDSLARIRRLYFAEPRSLGRQPMALERQADNAEAHREMVENVRWLRSGVLFATVHVVGSMNGLSSTDGEAAAAAVRRNQANVAWIQAAFAEAARTGAKAVVLAMHASFFDREPAQGQTSGRSVRGGRAGPYGLVAQAIQDLASAYGKPVLLIHGDDHEFILDRPFLARGGEGQKPKGANILRLQVYGAPEIRAVRIHVDPHTPWVFSFAPLFNE